MLTAERRGVSSRRGMTVLGKIPGVPKPINLPSQRLENRGLDPNVEIVPRGGVTWGASSRSPPVGGNAWGLGSSPPVGGAGGWSAPPSQTQTHAHPTPSATGSGAWPSSSNTTTAPIVSRPGPRPGSNDSDAWPAPSESLRPLSAGSASSQQHLGPGHSSWSGPGGSRALSSNNQLHVQHQGPSQRPRSAEVHPSTVSNTEPLLSELDSSSTSFHSGGPMPAWGGAGATQKRQEESSQQGPRFLLKNNEFPTLGADKDMDNHQQQHTMGGGSHHATEERPPRSPAYFDVHPTSPGHEGVPMDRPTGPDNWRRDAGSFAGPHDNWRRDGSHPHGHMGPPPDSWRRDAGQHGPQADNWRRDALGPNSFGHGAAPPGGGRYPMPPPEGFGPMPRFAAPLGMFNGPPMGPGPRGFLPADGYGPQGPFPRPGPGLHTPMVYGNVGEREMAMMGGGGRPGHYGVPGRGPPFPGQFGLPGKGPPQFPHFGNVQPMESYGKWGRYSGRPEGPRSSNLPLGGPSHPMGHSGPPRDHAFADPRGDLLGFDLDDARPSSGSQLRELSRDGRRDDGNAESSHPVGPGAGESHPGDAQESPLRNGDSREMSSEGQARDGGEMHGGSDARHPFHSSGSPPTSVAPHNNSGSSGIGNPFDHGPGHEEWAMVADEAMDFSKPAFPSDPPPPNNAVPSGPQLGGGPIGVQVHAQQQGPKAGRPLAMQQGGGHAQNWRGAQVKPAPPKRSTSPDWKQKKAVREVQSAGTASDAAKSFRGPQTVQAGGTILDQDGNQQQLGKAVRILKRHGDPEGTPGESSEAASFEATSKEASSAIVTPSPVSVATSPEDLRINDATVSDGKGNGGGPHATAPASAGPQSAPQATGSVLTALSMAGKGEGSLAKQPSPADVVKPGVGSVAGNGDQTVVHEAFAVKTGNHEAQREAVREDMEQRLHQRQEDEEKRGKEQKARAQAKLDDLNRRTGSQQTDAGSSKRVAEKGKEVSVAAALGVTSPDLPGIKAGAGNVEIIIGQDVNRSNRDGGRRGERRNGRVHKEKGEGGRGRGGAAAPNGPNGNGPAATSGPGPAPAPLPAPAAANSEPLLPSPSPAALLPSPQVQSQRGGGSQLSVAQGQAKNSPRHRRKQAKQGDAGNQESSAGTVAVANVVEGKDWLQPAAAAAAGGVAVPQSGAQGNQSAGESGGRKRRDGRSRDGRSRARRGEGKVDGDGSQTELVKSGGAKSEDGATGSSRGAQRRGGSGRREGRDRLPQDVHITEKSGTEGGAEAVQMGASNQSGRSRGGGRGSGSAGQSASGQEKHAADMAAGSSSDPNRGRRADMERYHPKPLAQKIEQQQLHGQDGHSHPVAEQAVGSRPEARANGTERQGVDPIVKSGGVGAGNQRQRPKQEGPASGAAIVEPPKADPRPGPRGVPSGEPQRPGAGPQRPGGSQGNVSSMLAAAILGLQAGHGTNPLPQQTPGSRVGAQVGVFVTPPMVRVGNGPQLRVPPPAGHVAGDGGPRNMQGQGVPKTPTGGKSGGHNPAVKGIGAADASTVKVTDGGVQQHQQQQPLQPVKAPQQQSMQTVVAPPQGGALSKADGAPGQGNIVRGTQYGVGGVRIRNVPSNVQNGTGSRHGQAGGGRGSGRPGQSTSGRGADAENRRDGSVKPRMVINATNGLMPGQASVT